MFDHQTLLKSSSIELFDNFKTVNYIKQNGANYY